MKPLTLLIPAALVIVLAAPGAAAQEDQDTKKVEDLIRDLGHEDVEKREKASEELRTIGKPALEALRGAAEKSEDPEVRARASRLVREIQKADRKDRRGPTAGSRISVRIQDGESEFRIEPHNQKPITFRRKADGAVELEYLDDQGKTATARSGSIEKFLEEHAELATKYGITAEGLHYAGTRLPFRAPALRFWRKDRDGDDDFRFPGFRFPDFRFPDFNFEELEEQYRRLHEEMRRMMDRWRREPWWRERGPEPREDLFESPETIVRGATFSPVPQLLRAHLGIPDGQGLVVQAVREGSTGAALGLQTHDVILEVDGKKVTGAEVLRREMTRDSAVHVLRAGKEQILRAEKK